MSSGPRVKLNPRQRADLGDVLALQSLVYDYIGQVMGGLLGPCSGSLTGGLFTATTPSTPSPAVIPIRKGVLVGVDYDADGFPVADVVAYDPDDPVQSGNTSVDLTGVVGFTGWVWWAKDRVDVDELTRVFWTTGPTHQPTLTRQVDRVVFSGTAGSDPPPDASRKWYKLGRISAWASNVPTLRTMHPFDLSDDGIAWNGATFRASLSQGAAPGLTGAAQALAVQLATLQDGDADVSLQGAVATEGDETAWSRQGQGVKQFIEGLAAIDGATPTTLLASGAPSAMNIGAFGVAFCSGLADGSGTMGPGTSTRVRDAVVTTCGVLSTAEMASRTLTGGTGSVWLYFRHPTVTPNILQLLLTQGRSPSGSGTAVTGCEVADTASFAVGAHGAFAEVCFQVQMWGSGGATDGKVNFIAITG